MTQPIQAQIEAAKNTDRELWRDHNGDYYGNSIFVTESGGIGINCGGSVVVKPLREWFALTAAAEVGDDWVGEIDRKAAKVAALHIADVRAATIERCAQLAETYQGPRSIADAIRALKDQA